MLRSSACNSLALFAALGQLNASFAQSLFQFAWIKPMELIPADEHQRHTATAVTLKFSEGPAIALYILLAERYSMLP